MNFKKFLLENEDLKFQIMEIIDSLSEEQIDEFGAVLYYEFFDLAEEDDVENTVFDIDFVKAMIEDLGVDIYGAILDLLEPETLELDEGKTYNLEVTVNIAGAVQEFLKSDFRGAYKAEDSNYFAFKKEDDLYDAVLSLVDLKIMSKKDIINVDIDLDELDEGVSRIMKAGDRNKKKRKFMGKSAAELRKTAGKRKKDNRKTKAKRKRYATANKTKIKAYQKSRSDAVKSGKHNVKLRKKAG